MSHKVIASEELEDCKRWELPSVRGPVAQNADGPLLTAKQIDGLQKKAYEEAFALGRKDGNMAGRQEIQHRVNQLEQLMSTLTEPLEQLDEQVENELASLAMAVARLLIRRELKADPGEIVGVVREAVSALPVAKRDVTLYLHPDDAALVREVLCVSDDDRAWRIREDPVLTRGGCRVATDVSQIDATVETRVAAAVAQVLGGEREGDDDGS